MHDPELVSARKVYAKSPNMSNTQKATRIKSSVRSGDNNGTPWPTKQALTYLRKFNTAKAKPKANAKAKAKAKAESKAQTRTRMQRGMRVRVLGANILA